MNARRRYLAKRRRHDAVYDRNLRELLFRRDYQAGGGYIRICGLETCIKRGILLAPQALDEPRCIHHLAWWTAGRHATILLKFLQKLPS